MLGSDCGSSPGIVMHEIMHALGFYHEHNRPDRNAFVTVQWQNIEPGEHLCLPTCNKLSFSSMLQ